MLLMEVLRLEDLLRLIETNHTIKKLMNDCPYSILAQMELRSFKPRKFFLAQGEFHSSVYIIVSGQINVFVSEENGRHILLDVYKRGNFIGEQEAYLNVPYSASLENMTDCLLIEIPNNTFIEWVSLDTIINKKLILSLCEQMYDLTNRAAKYSLSTVKEQVIMTLLDLHNKNNNIDKKLLVASVSATPRSVYRILNELENLELITLDSKHITIIDQKKILLERKKI